MTNLTFTRARRDAGELRRYLALRYGKVLLRGGSFEAYCRALRIGRALARATGLSLDDVMDFARSDAEIFHGEEN